MGLANRKHTNKMEAIMMITYRQVGFIFCSPVSSGLQAGNKNITTRKGLARA
jgi:hypothetical protein